METMSVPAGGALPPDVMLAHAGSIRALALSILGDEHAAEDVLQETWIRALEKPPPRHDSVGGWLRRVAEGLAISRLRSDGRRRVRETHWVEDRDCAHSSYDATERAEVLRAVVDEVLALDEPYREAVMRRYFEGLPPREIAKATDASVATVNSRLQRAQAKLKEKLDRRLSDRCGGMRSALLVLVGMPDEAIAASTAGWFTQAVVVKVAGALAGVAAVVAVALWIGGGDDGARRVEPLAVADTGAVARSSGGLTETAAARAERTDAVTLVAPVPSVIGRPIEAPIPAEFAFDVAIEPLDATGRATAGCRVWLGPEPGPLALVGNTDWDGALRLRWRGDEPEVALVVRAARAGLGSTPLRRVRVRAGSPQVVKLGLDGARAAEGDVPVLGDLPIVGAAFSGRPRRDLARFLSDSAGNGVFEDPWLFVGGDEPSVAAGLAALTPFAEIGRGRTLGSEAARAGLEVRVLDADGRPVPRALVSFSAAEGGFREDHSTGPSGIAHALAIPPGSVLVVASASEAAGPFVTRRLEVEANARLTLDLALPRVPWARIRLVDGDGAPRAGWLVELRDESGSTLARAQLDAEGRATLPIESGGPVALLARADATGAGVVIESALLAHDFEQVLAATFAPHERSLRVVVRGEGSAAAVVRVARVDSGEALDAAPTDDPELEGAGRHAFRARGLSRGLHRVQVGAPTRGWIDAGVVEISGGRGSEVVEVELGDCAKLKITNGDVARLRLTGHRAGMRIASPDVRAQDGGSLSAAPGSYELLVWRRELVGTLRTIDLAPGLEARVE